MVPNIPGKVSTLQCLFLYRYDEDPRPAGFGILASSLPIRALHAVTGSRPHAVFPI
jgi:hypothetical protein